MPTPQTSPAQSLAVKRAEVEFHRFASLGEPEVALRVYREENLRRAAVIRAHLGFIGSMSPFLEIGANAGHTSYMLANEFGCDGFALDISADALRYGIELKRAWQLDRQPVRLASDAESLPFQDGSLRMVCAFQLLSQFQNMDAVFREVTRVLAPGGIFLFAEEPVRRRLTLGLYRCPYEVSMKPWERRLHAWGLLGYLVRDVIGARQEESFGIRQNHRMYWGDWQNLIRRHFAAHEYQVFVAERGWGERLPRRLFSERRRAGLLGGTIAAVCRKAGAAPALPGLEAGLARFLRCPDCHANLSAGAVESLRCDGCGFTTISDEGVYNLLPSRHQAALYPGDRPDIADFSRPGHEARLLDGWHELEGVFGNKYRWMGATAALRLDRCDPGPRRLRIRGFAHEESFRQGRPVTVAITVNQGPPRAWKLDRPGLFVLESDVPDSPSYHVRIVASPLWTLPPDDRVFSVNLSLVRLVPRDS